tara:strand:- start:458 stop:589 length:132 start_codon:yes stop_codon:yes gene_type:complete
MIVRFSFKVIHYFCFPLDISDYMREYGEVKGKNGPLIKKEENI